MGVGSPQLILVAEDEALIAMDLVAGLEEYGFKTVLVSTCRDGLFVLSSCKPVAAVLDVNLKDESCERLAEALSAANVPYIFHTGYSSETSQLPAKLRRTAWIAKPSRAGVVADALLNVITRNRERGASEDES